MSGSEVGSGVITSNGSRSVLGIWLISNRIFRSRRLGSFISRHLLVHYLQVQVLQINTRGVLNEVAPQQLKAFKVSTEEYGVVLVSLLESFNGPGRNGLELVLGHQKLLILFQR